MNRYSADSVGSSGTSILPVVESVCDLVHTRFFSLERCNGPVPHAATARTPASATRCLRRSLPVDICVTLRHSRETGSLETALSSEESCELPYRLRTLHLRKAQPVVLGFPRGGVGVGSWRCLFSPRRVDSNLRSLSKPEIL